MWKKGFFEKFLHKSLCFLLPMLTLSFLSGCYNNGNNLAGGKGLSSRFSKNSRYSIMGQGQSTEQTMFAYLRQYNPQISTQKLKFIVRTYLWESQLEGVNHDVAFAQMCHETNFLKFGGVENAKQNNFCALDSLNYDITGACFFSIKEGIRAHTQHLKAYGSRSSLKNKCVDPRFSLVQRGVAADVYDLTSRWVIDGDYGNAIKRKIDMLLAIAPLN